MHHRNAKQLSKLAKNSAKLSNLGYHTFCTYSGHTDHVSLRIYFGKWTSGVSNNPNLDYSGFDMHDPTKENEFDKKFHKDLMNLNSLVNQLIKEVKAGKTQHDLSRYSRLVKGL